MDGFQIALIVVGVLTVFLGGYAKKVAKEAKEFFGAIEIALNDGKITKEELAEIIKEGNDVKTAILEIAQLIIRKR